MGGVEAVGMALDSRDTSPTPLSLSLYNWCGLIRDHGAGYETQSYEGYVLKRRRCRDWYQSLKHLARDGIFTQIGLAGWCYHSLHYP